MTYQNNILCMQCDSHVNAVVSFTFLLLWFTLKIFESVTLNGIFIWCIKHTKMFTISKFEKSKPFQIVQHPIISWEKRISLESFDFVIMQSKCYNEILHILHCENQSIKSVIINKWGDLRWQHRWNNQQFYQCTNSVFYIFFSSFFQIEKDHFSVYKFVKYTQVL